MTKPTAGLNALVHFPGRHLDVPEVVGHRCRHPERVAARADRAGGVQVVRVALEVLRAHECRRREPDVAAHGVPRADRVAIRIAPRVDASERGLRQEPPPHSAHGKRLADGADVVARADLEEPDVLASHLAREFRAVVDGLWCARRGQPDPAAEKRVHDEIATERTAEREVRRAVQEEIALLRKEQRVPREVHLALVDLRLGEIGVDREHAAQPRRRVVEDVHARFGIFRDAGIAAARRRLAGGERVGFHVEPVSLADVSNSGHEPGVRHSPQSLVARPPHPDAVLVLATNRALEVDAPLVAVRIEVQRAKGDFNLDRPPEGVAIHARIPDAVPLPVVDAAAHQRITHQTRRVHLEEVSGARVEEGVDGPHEPIVGRQELVAAALVPEPLLRLRVVAEDPEVQAVPAECHPHLRGLGGRPTVRRIDLDEICGRCHRLPELLIETAVQGDHLRFRQADGRDAPA